MKTHDDEGNVVRDERLVYVCHIDTRRGPIHLASTLHGLLLVGLDGQDRFFADLKRFFPDPASWVDAPEASEDAAMMLKEFLEGARTDFGPNPPLYDLRDATDFQRAVWQELQQIPYGATLSYGDIAQRLNSRAARAVGGACGRNRLPIFIPCHRVVRADGSPGGFSAGIGWKAFLLEHEKTPPQKEGRR